MSQVVAIVIKLDNGKYRRLNLDRNKSIYTDSKYIASGTLKDGEGDVAGPETDTPDFSPTASTSTRTRAEGAMVPRIRKKSLSEVLVRY